MGTESRIRVLTIITRLDLGGAQQVALQSAAGLDSERFDSVLLCGRGGKLDRDAAVLPGLQLHFLRFLKHPISPLQDFLAVLEIWIYLMSRRVDVVHTHSSKAGLIGRLAAFAAGIPVVIHTVHGWSFHDFMGNLKRRMFIYLEKWLARITTVLVVVAESVRDKGMMNGIGTADQYALIRAGVDTRHWRFQEHKKDALEAILATAALGPVVGCIANCKEQKNPLDFVRVAQRVLQMHPIVSFIYLGDGPLRESALQLAQELGLKDQVFFPGWVEDPAEAAAGFDIFLLMSLWEGLPCVFPQVLSQGTVAVATSVDGAAEIIREGHNGFLVQPFDVDAAADRINWLLAHSSVRATLREKARESVGSEFDMATTVESVQRLYLHLLGEKQ